MKNLIPRSLKHKVLLGYILGFLLMSGVIIVNWSNFEKMQSLVLSGERVSELIDTILEVRRYEKNYFLYGKEEDFMELSLYLDRLKTLISENKKDIELFSDKELPSAFEKDIRGYEAAFSRLRNKNGEVNYLEGVIRNKGRDIVKKAEALSDIKKERIGKVLLVSRNILTFSIVFLVSAGFIAGAFFYRSFARPLMLFEKHMKKIAEGEYSFIPVLSQDREMLSLSKAFNRMLVELELRQSHLIRTEKLASLGTLLFGVAHELNNPLNNISTSCQILREEIETADPEFKKELLSQIESETDRARDIVRSILDYSKTGTREVVNISNLVREAIKFIKAEVPPKVELALEIPEDITVEADPQQLKQVFLNLIKNSIEAMDGEGKVTISAKHHDPHIEIRVTDTGKGMSQEVLSKIFDPFFTTKEGRKGYGLGLFVTHNIIKEHGGTIDVQSSPGHGTTFLIRLPEREDEG
ncbi:MAG: ATP-binding protein [Thermodesulfovibrionales bacterium]